MITQCCYLKKYDWLVKVFYEASIEEADIILKELEDIDCDPDAFYSFAEILESEKPDLGFTYTDNQLHVTFIVLCESTSASEFRNTLDHEKGHAVTHICSNYNIDPYSEELQYLSLDLGQLMFEIAQRFMCDNCRLNFYNYGKIKIKMY